ALDIEDAAVTGVWVDHESAAPISGRVKLDDRGGARWTRPGTRAALSANRCKACSEKSARASIAARE
ncbi:MAG: hypothetical protein ACREMY_08875, partial [bacterium]